jgi:hypothetical protein
MPGSFRIGSGGGFLGMVPSRIATSLGGRGGGSGGQPGRPAVVDPAVGHGHHPAAPARAAPRRPKLFPRYTVVGFYGMQGLDVLGAGEPDVVAERLLKVARPYAQPGRPVMPMFELIATVAHPFPTPSGLYRTHQEDEIVQGYLEAVRRIDGVLVLDVQPGRDDFVASLRHWERYLRQPDVGIALDPEFAMGPARSRARTWAAPTPMPSTGPRPMWPGSCAATGCPRSCS